MAEVVEPVRKKKRKKKVRTKPRSYRMIELSRVHPNDWNPNRMTPEIFKKLKAGIKATLAEAGEIPPIVVRPSSKDEGDFEIIDGFHRWQAMTELKQAKIGVFVLKVSDKNARILTRTLNYLKGQPDRGLYAQGLVELIEVGATEEELIDLLPESVVELEQLWEEAEVTTKASEMLWGDEDDEGDEVGSDPELENLDDVWVDMKFRVTVGQAEVIERELVRIGERLKGKAKRSRAVEFMAVQSSQTALPEDLT